MKWFPWFPTSGSHRFPTKRPDHGPHWFPARDVVPPEGNRSERRYHFQKAEPVAHGR